ncbi:MAG: (2Fe-2S)-binding protein [Gammaproteobacteria bacterium]|nr:(2Fe-2S)-binding protein [Gammaproteobacteria bacterium]MBU2005606.1 (2Fe-2S)-binding protein [Gammaproteobacteria bacterium]
MSNMFFIDGQEIAFTPGQTIMDAALAAGIYIPHLCHKPGLTPQGSCKLCTVDVDGRSASACTLPATAGMKVDNNTPALQEVRKTLLQMLFVEGNHLCPTCLKSGDCTLQALGYHLGMLDGHFPPFYPLREVDASHPDVLLDRDRCIVCALCVRASREVDGKNVFAIGRRGANARLIVNSPSGKLGDSDLAADDLAAHICPVGAIMPKNHGFEVPIGRRTFDLHSVAESDVATPVTLKKTEHHDE